MIFYEVTRPTGTTFLAGTQVDAKTNAKAVGGTYSQIDIPVDKQGLMTFINKLHGRISSLDDIIQATTVLETTKPGFIPPTDVEIVVRNGVMVENLEPVPVALRIPDEKGMIPEILEAQVEALGEGGTAALERLSLWQDTQGIGASFARGVILLCILAAGEHQLARILHKKKVQKA